MNRIDLYREAAGQVGVSVPDSAMRRATLLDGRVWDGGGPAAYAAGFELHGSGYRRAA